MLLIAVVGALVIATAGHLRMPTRPTTCCRKVSNALIQNIKEYKEQEADDPCLHAIIFTTEDKKKFCSNPKLPWVKEQIKELEQKKLKN
ncbi:eotaxin-like [Sardina pilchardus]|uniref:eotaxin-like n=1 Tax=Sardina pilchardus TaxID=27697 RepID=UPI002E0D88CD